MTSNFKGSYRGRSQGCSESQSDIEAFKLLGKIDGVNVLATEARYHEPCRRTTLDVMVASIVKLVAVTLALVQWQNEKQYSNEFDTVWEYDQISRSGHSLTLNISEMAKYTAMVTMEGEYETAYPSFQMIPFPMTLSDLWPTFQGYDNIQRQITRLMVSGGWSIQWFCFQWPWVTLDLDLKVMGN